MRTCRPICLSPWFTFAVLFSAKKQACGPEARALRGKSIGGKRNPSGDHPCFRKVRRAYRALENSEFGMWNSEFFLLFPIPHSAFYIPHFGCPPGPRNETRLMVFARNALAFGPGNA
jgi:hypothetical protein